MFRLIENWPSFRATITNINMDLHSIVRSIASTTNCSKGKHYLRECHAERPPRLDRLLDNEMANSELQLQHCWSHTDKSPHINVREEGMISKRRPIAKSTDCIRGRVGYVCGLHVWYINWPTSYRGTHAVVGVATDEAPLQSPGYCSLVGSNNESWGWDLVKNKCYHKGVEHTYPSWLSTREVFQIPDEFMVVLDMDDGTLGFIVDNVYLGVAFSGLKGKKLYPIISTVWGNGEIGIKYFSGLEPGPLLLQECCRKVIRNTVGKERLKSLKSSQLQLPNTLKDYILN